MAEETLSLASRDGTRIAAYRSGSGSPLVFVHGTAADHHRWGIVLPRLRARYTCYALDRRGRGGSGDGPTYSLEREVDDLVAVLEAVGGRADLLGHSFGGLVAMEAARVAKNLRRLILYEPAAYLPQFGVYPEGILDELEWLLANGERDELVVRMLRDIAGVPESDIAVLRRRPTWAARMEAAHTIPRELRVDERYVGGPERLSTIRVPTALLLGSESPDYYRKATAALQRAIPDSRIIELPGQGHAAIDTGSRIFVDAVLGFLSK